GPGASPRSGGQGGTDRPYDVDRGARSGQRPAPGESQRRAGIGAGDAVKRGAGAGDEVRQVAAIGRVHRTRTGTGAAGGDHQRRQARPRAKLLCQPVGCGRRAAIGDRRRRNRRAAPGWQRSGRDARTDQRARRSGRVVRVGGHDGDDRGTSTGGDLMGGEVGGGGIRVVLAEDQTMVVEAFAELLNLQPDITVCATAKNGVDALAAVAEHDPDVLVADIEMPRGSGLDVAAELHRRGSRTKVLIVTTFARSGYLRRAMDAGVTGYVLKDAPI